MANSRINLFCVVDGEPQLKAFSVKVTPADTVDDLKDLIKAKNPATFDGVDAKDLALWLASVPVATANKHNPVVLSKIRSPTELYPTQEISDVFRGKLPKDTIHIIVRRPPQGIHTLLKPIRLSLLDHLLSLLTIPRIVLPKAHRCRKRHG
ncbi:MAG: hypothetical protein J3R72DRAFT_463131 [Linnemannia gamsii]|nr:MAG: hypothetical protein J3R72DRAFT_463131 [Linnemannia gamsii]